MSSAIAKLTLRMMLLASVLGCGTSRYLIKEQLYWIQELYRTRIRNRNGEKIHLAALGEEDMIALLEQEIHQDLVLYRTMSGPWNMDGYERFLQGQKKQTQRELWKELKKHKQVCISTFAKHHTRRSVDKVWRALKALL